MTLIIIMRCTVENTVRTRFTVRALSANGYFTVRGDINKLMARMRRKYLVSVLLHGVNIYLFIYEKKSFFWIIFFCWIHIERSIYSFWIVFPIYLDSFAIFYLSIDYTVIFMIGNYIKVNCILLCLLIFACI